MYSLVNEIDHFWETTDGTNSKLDYERIVKCAKHFIEWERNRQALCGSRGRLGGIPEEIMGCAEEYANKLEPPYDRDDVCNAYAVGAMKEKQNNNNLKRF